VSQHKYTQEVEAIYILNCCQILKNNRHKQKGSNMFVRPPAKWAFSPRVGLCVPDTDTTNMDQLLMMLWPPFWRIFL